MGIYSWSTADSFNLHNFPKSGKNCHENLFQVINAQLFQLLIICVTSSSPPCTDLWKCSEAGVWFLCVCVCMCVFSLVLWSRWNRGTHWTALRSSLTLHPTNWFSWTSCSPEQWCLARCEPPCMPSLIYSAYIPSLCCTPTSYWHHLTDHLIFLELSLTLNNAFLMICLHLTVNIFRTA